MRNHSKEVKNKNFLNSRNRNRKKKRIQKMKNNKKAY